ncbi:hypothetical protein HID58_072588 [Brassica napus]|uniref:Uncharacterized protein n=1 Tax=Brassica napus TaxID=3708 RepID=A0ABQ7Z506_BRANA|nr:hypothetical protein HID58_072588 [Brassica napus]
MYLSSSFFSISRCCLWHGSPSAPLDNIESTLEINCSLFFFILFFSEIYEPGKQEREETEFVEKGEEATAARHHTTIVRYHPHHRHLSRPPSLVTTTIASPIRLHRSRHHHRSPRGMSMPNYLLRLQDRGGWDELAVMGGAERRQI